ncbi:nuclease-related domain-containing protein [Saccharococcus caldoxylosilyticus]|uniref:nuclease-related domain-containing protein n=1 Tax=Saccharococcus caldoxylosilyticus TaxID=81408 RepID=UPI0002FCAEE9|nr:nuclease-related domain-containing protein [Parageobacillus caldoxylosilyticus]
MDFIYIFIILALSVLCIYLLKRQRTMEQTFKQNQAEMAVTMEQTENQYKQSLKEEIENIERLYQKKINDLVNKHSNEIGELHNYIDDLKKLHRNRGEIITHQILTDLKTKLVQQGKISPNEMIIIPNVFVPFTENNVIKTRQIDHLILLPTDIYIIETKYWRGKVLHGLTKENAGEFSFILDALFPQQRNDVGQTIVFVKESTDESNEVSSMKIVSYENPSVQVVRTAVTLRNFLKDLNPKFDYVEPILYYAYDSDNFNDVIIYSKKGKPIVFNSEKDLVNYFEEQLKRKKKFTVNDLEEIKQIVEQVNYIS